MVQPPRVADTPGDDRVKKLCTNGIVRLVAQLARVAPGHDPLRGLVQDDAVVGDEKDARQLVGHDDDRDAEVAAERDDQLIELDRA